MFIGYSIADIYSRSMLLGYTLHAARLNLMCGRFNRDLTVVRSGVWVFVLPFHELCIIFEKVIWIRVT